MSEAEKKIKRLIEIASAEIGIIEEGGDNKGARVELYQNVVDKKASGEPWCMAFVQWCIAQVENEFNSPSLIHKSESVIETWNKTPNMCRLEKPQPGAIMIWRMHDSLGKPTVFGHCGIVESRVSEILLSTIEGNTGPGSSYEKIEREGDGVYKRIRAVDGSFVMRVEGWLLPWV